METDDDRKTKKINVEITHKEVDIGEGNSVLIYNVEIHTDYATWEELATSKEHLEAVIRGINMTFDMMGVHSGIPTGIRTPFSKEIICYKGHVCKGFESL